LDNEEESGQEGKVDRGSDLAAGVNLVFSFRTITIKYIMEVPVSKK
jgi:hypothetical protein